MAYQYLPTLQTSTNGASGNLIAGSANQSIRIWQIMAANSVSTAALLTVGTTAAGNAWTTTVAVPGNSTVVLPASGVPYVIADVNTNVTYAGVNGSLTIQAYFTKGLGG